MKAFLFLKGIKQIMSDKFINTFNSNYDILGIRPHEIKIIYNEQILSGICLDFNFIQEIFEPEFYMPITSSHERIETNSNRHHIFTIRISNLISSPYNSYDVIESELSKRQKSRLEDLSPSPIQKKSLSDKSKPKFKLDENLYYENLTMVEHLKKENNKLENENKDQRFLIEQMNNDLESKNKEIKNLEEKLKKYGLLELKPENKSKNKYDRFKLLEKEVK